MKPLIVLISTFFIALLTIKLIVKKYEIAFSARISLCSMLLFTAIGHFTFSKGMSLMLAPMVPMKTEIIYITGILEIILGFALLIPRVRVFTGWTLITFFILMLPANIYAAINHVNFQEANYNGPGITYLWFRIPLQFLFIIWTYLSSIRPYIKVVSS